jgi:ABC-type antimicrobial peptide transport system permease subunit
MTSNRALPCGFEAFDYDNDPSLDELLFLREPLGAEERTVRNMVIGQGMRVALPGILIGVVAAFALARVLDGFLFGVTVHDPLVFASVPLLLTAVAFIAVWLPSQLASRVNPVVALRSE